MNKKVAILGTHQLAADVRRQYEAMGDSVVTIADAMLSANLSQPFDADGFDAYCLLYDDDHVALSVLRQLAEKVFSHRPIVHLLLHSRTVLRLVQTVGLDETILSRLDVYAFTLAEEWAGAVKLDRVPITSSSEQTVHLVIFGMGDMAETISIRAALTAHYPNYVRNHALRTRITFVDPDARHQSVRLIQRYPHLFANSYYRVVVPVETKPVVLFHQPDSVAAGMDEFVDVEWEFVESSFYDPMLREKLQLWAADQGHQQLTVVMAEDNERQNLDKAIALPDMVHEMKTPVYVCLSDDTVLNQIAQTGVMENLHPIGMTYCGYDVRQPLVQMAKSINYIYNQCYRDNEADWTGRLRYTVEIDSEERDALWQRVSPVKRMSNICNAMTIATKMRSVGLQEGEWDRFYDIPQPDIELLAQVEHNRWSVEELIFGWRPCTMAERQEVTADISRKEELKKRKVHYDLCSYRELGTDATGKPVTIYDLCLCSCLPLIAKSFSKEDTI